MIRSLATGKLRRFLIVGVFSTVVNYGVFYALLVLGVNYIVAATIGFLVGVAAGYSLNKRWTFGFAEASSFRLVASYWAVYTLSLLCGLLLVRTLVESFGVDPRLANLAAIVMTTCTNFLGTRFLVFRR